MRLLIYITFSILLSSCLQKPPFYEESKRLNHYLKENFDYSLDKSKEVFFIIPSSYCSGCKQHLLFFLNETKHEVMLITVDETIKGLAKNINVLYDKVKKVDRINIGVANASVVVTENQKIVQIIEVKAGDNLDTYFLD